MCTSGDSVIRFFWPGQTVSDSRHRYVVDPAEADRMRAAGWLEEGASFALLGSQCGGPLLALAHAQAYAYR